MISALGLVIFVGIKNKQQNNDILKSQGQFTSLFRSKLLLS